MFALSTLRCGAWRRCWALRLPPVPLPLRGERLRRFARGGLVLCGSGLNRAGAGTEGHTASALVQAARSGKQNIVEGFADGVTSTEMELKLLNVARASLKELKEDYLDYLRRHALSLWGAKYPRYDGLLKFCRERNELADYQAFFTRWTDEELANCAVTLCHMVDKMMSTFLEKKEADFTENGGIRECMTAARLGRRQTQNEEIAALKAEVAKLRAENASLRRELEAAIFVRGTQTNGTKF